MSEDTHRRSEPRTGVISATSVQARDPNRISIFVEGTFSFGMPLEAALEMDLRKGLEMDEVLLARCLAADEEYKARKKALNLLAFRQRSTGELDERLRRAGFSDAARRAALARMQKLGYLDDAAFAEAFARDRMGVRGHGRRRVLLELGRKGIAPSLAEQVVALVSEGRNEVEDALALARKKARSLRRLDNPRKKRERLWGHLSRRGFESDVIRAALAQLAEETIDEPRNAGTEEDPMP
ncbi:MAG: RecX family transcriptional regulator [Rhodothermales bacterium]|nr:RecX family transcriptional regulator [Rhodothermales bacterium]